MAHENQTPTDLIPDDEGARVGRDALTWHVPVPDRAPPPDPVAPQQPHEKVASFLSKKPTSPTAPQRENWWRVFVKRFSALGRRSITSTKKQAPVQSGIPARPTPTHSPVPASALPPAEGVPVVGLVPAQKISPSGSPVRTAPVYPGAPAPVPPPQVSDSIPPSESLVRAIPLPRRHTGFLTYTKPVRPPQDAPSTVAVSLTTPVSHAYPQTVPVLLLVAIALTWTVGTALVVRAGHSLASEAEQTYSRAAELEQSVATMRASREGGMSRARAVSELAKQRFDWIDFLDKVRAVTVPGVVYARFSGTAFDSVNLFVRTKDYATFVAQLRSYESAGFVKQRIIQGVRQRQVEGNSAIIESEIVLQLQ